MASGKRKESIEACHQEGLDAGQQLWGLDPAGQTSACLGLSLMGIGLGGSQLLPLEMPACWGGGHMEEPRHTRADIHDSLQN